MAAASSPRPPTAMRSAVVPTARDESCGHSRQLLAPGWGRVRVRVGVGVRVRAKARVS